MYHACRPRFWGPLAYALLWSVEPGSSDIGARKVGPIYFLCASVRKWGPRQPQLTRDKAFDIIEKFHKWKFFCSCATPVL